MNRVPRPGFETTRTRPPTDRTMSWTTSSPTPRPEISVTEPPWSRTRGGRGTRAARPRSGGRPSRAEASPLRTTLSRKPGRVDPPAVVAHGDLEHPRAVAGLQADDARSPPCRRPPARSGGSMAWSRALRIRWLSGASSLSRMSRSTPVDLPPDLESDLLAQLSGDLADHPGEAADALRHRPHPAGEDLVMEPAGEVLAAPGVVVERLEPRGSARQRTGPPRPWPWPGAPPRPPTPDPRPRPDIRRSSTACNAPINADWRRRSPARASTNGRSCRAWTSDSPARPISLERLSAETRTHPTRRLRGRRAGRRRAGAGAGPSPEAMGSGSGTTSATSLSRRERAGSRWLRGVGRSPFEALPARSPAMRRPSPPAPLPEGEGRKIRPRRLVDGSRPRPQPFQARDGRPDEPLVLRPATTPDRSSSSRRAIRPRRSTALSIASTAVGADRKLAALGGDEVVLERVGDADGGVEADDPGGPLERVGGPHQRLERRRRRRRVPCPSRASRPSVRSAVWPSASERNRSIREKPLRSSPISGPHPPERLEEPGLVEDVDAPTVVPGEDGPAEAPQRVGQGRGDFLEPVEGDPMDAGDLFGRERPGLGPALRTTTRRGFADGSSPGSGGATSSSPWSDTQSCNCPRRLDQAREDPVGPVRDPVDRPGRAVTSATIADRAIASHSAPEPEDEEGPRRRPNLRRRAGRAGRTTRPGSPSGARRSKNDRAARAKVGQFRQWTCSSSSGQVRSPFTPIRFQQSSTPRSSATGSRPRSRLMGTTFLARTRPARLR